MFQLLPLQPDVFEQVLRLVLRIPSHPLILFHLFCELTLTVAKSSSYLHRSYMRVLFQILQVVYHFIEAIRFLLQVFSHLIAQATFLFNISLELLGFFDELCAILIDFVPLSDASIEETLAIFAHLYNTVCMDRKIVALYQFRYLFQETDVDEVHVEFEPLETSIMLQRLNENGARSSPQVILPQVQVLEPSVIGDGNSEELSASIRDEVIRQVELLKHVVTFYAGCESFGCSIAKVAPPGDKLADR